MTRDEIQKEIDRLRALDRKLEEKELARYESRAKQFVGKCYRNADKVFKILSIPKKTYGGDFRWHYRKHYFPILWLQYESLPDDYDDFYEYSPLYCDELYFDVTQFDEPYCCTEITQEEFNAEFDKCIAYFKELINV